MPKILILTVPHGAAHQRIARALEKALVELDPGASVEVADLLTHTAGWFRAYYNSYQIPLRYWPGLWAWIEGQQHEGSSTGPGWLYRRGARPLRRFLESHDPDVVVATETGICEMAAMIKREARLRYAMVGVDGLDADRAWAQPEVDLYAVAKDPVSAQLVAAGVPPQKIVACGMLLDPLFSALPDRAAARRKLGVSDRTPLLLALGGGDGFARPRLVIPALDKVRAPLQVVFVAGRNARLRREYESRSVGNPRYRVLGWIDNMHEWMAAADLVLNKPSGLAMMEAMACGLPFLAIDPLPGNERRHCDLIERWGTGRWIRRHADLPTVVDHLLADPEECARMRRRALELATPHAARDAAQAILKLAEHRGASGKDKVRMVDGS